MNICTEFKIKDVSSDLLHILYPDQNQYCALLFFNHVYAENFKIMWQFVFKLFLVFCSFENDTCRQYNVQIKLTKKFSG